MDGMMSSQLISDVKGRHVESVPGNRNEYKVTMAEDAEGAARIEGTLSTDGTPVPVTRVVLKKTGGEDATFIVKYKTNENDDTWETFEARDGTKVEYKIHLIEYDLTSWIVFPGICE